MGLPRHNNATQKRPNSDGVNQSNKGSSLSGSYVWVKTDFVEAIVCNRGTLPAGWKPRKRIRSTSNVQLEQNGDDNQNSSWGWCRARVSTATTPRSTKDRDESAGRSNISTQEESSASDNGNLFAHVKLRKTKRPVIETPTKPGDEKNRNLWIGSPDTAPKTVSVTVIIDDAEFAPSHLQNRTISFTYETSDVTKVCRDNSWWQTEHSQPPDDLTTLEHLHEPAVVFCLQKRYELGQIYTYTGKILLALNPFRPVEGIYSEKTMKLYWNGGARHENDHSDRNSGTSIASAAARSPPHVYAVAADAYISMMRSFDVSSLPETKGRGTRGIEVTNQSILVSGESGAGKTVTTKIILRYLANLSAEKHKLRDRHGQNVASIESQVLGWNPILESFGNARTMRNDNSSRFGKFMEMQFESTGCLVSASLETYLLEKVRLISQAPGERNYHVFYEILAGLPRVERERLLIANKTVVDFRMTASSGTSDRRDGVEDRDSYDQLKNAFDTVGFTKSEQQDLNHVVCALLHTSNLSFRERSADGSIIDQTNPSFLAAVSLLGVDEKALNDALTKCAIVVRSETVFKNLPVDRAMKAAEAFIKSTYGALFTWIVRKINNSVKTQQALTSRTPSAGVAVSNSSRYPGPLPNPALKTASIGVLDIFGFESFDRNSFEQLCINYCNEALQQQFNRFVFKIEQQEYEKEGIEWSFIEFPDNQDVLDLIEKKHDGILSILDEQCRLPRCTDSTFAAAIYAKLEGHARIEITKTQRARLTFAIQHYAGPVEYDTELFLEKNKDELPKETTELLISSSYVFLANLGRELTDASTSSSSTEHYERPRMNAQLSRSSSSLIRDSVGIQFCSQLRVLRSRIESTEPHYIRCLKPNDNLIPFSFNPLVIADQLRCAGVLEAIRVSRLGFPHRYYHAQFAQRYALLATHNAARHQGYRTPVLSDVEMCKTLIEILSPDIMNLLNEGAENCNSFNMGSSRSVFLGMQLGKSKVFLRRRAFEALEYIRNKKLDKSAIIIQSIVRMHFQKCNYRIIFNAVLRIQHFARKVEAYVRQREQWIKRSATLIQASIRGIKPRRQLHAARWIALWCQNAYRGASARQYCAYLFLDRNAAVIQRSWRRSRMRAFFRKLRRSIISVQNRLRSRYAFRELCRLRREAKDLKAIAAERDKFREESRRLRMELEKAKNASPSLTKHADKESEIQKLRHELQRLHFELEKAHRMGSPSKRNEESARRLIEELANKEDELDRLKRELDNLRSRDESSSTRSLTVATSFASEFSFRIPKQRASPVRSDASLLDNDENYFETKMFDTFCEGPPDASLVGEGLQGLHNAIRMEDYKVVDHILHATSEACVLINQGDRYGRAAMHIASLTLNTEIAEALITRGAVVNAQDDDGETPLHLAENANMTEVLLTKGKANPNIPNVDGICALHLAVQRRDVESVRLLVNKNANVNNADNVRWFTSLHLIALPARVDVDAKFTDNSRWQIAQILTSSRGLHKADLNYQDSEGNTPLHYAVQLETGDSFDLVTLFLECGANPNIRNVRDQIPLHLLCHNTELRKSNIFQETIHVLLMHGADPNLQSLTGCTPLHLSLYHRDVDTAVQLVGNGAELHLIWKKPKRWPSFWKDMGSSRVVALDMVEDTKDLYRLLSAITVPNTLAPNRSWCMHCKKGLSRKRGFHCRRCSRLTCDACSNACLSPEYYPEHFKVTEASWTCTVCERILTGQKEVSSAATHPLSSYGDDDDRFSC